MKTIGIVAEWNPFHKGHQKLVDTIRENDPNSVIVSCMSGSFTQRGEVGVVDKWTRADMALRAGVDVVLELSQTYAAQSMEIFARGGVHTLMAFAPLDGLYCGSESGDVAALNEAADFLRKNRALFEAHIHALTQEGVSFGEASQDFLHAHALSFGTDKACPNDRLALSYRLSLPANVPMQLVTRHSGHHSHTPVQGELSGTALRALLPHHLEKATAYLPQTSVDILRALANTAWHEAKEDILLHALKVTLLAMRPEEVAARLAIRDGWERRFTSAVAHASSMDEVLTLAQTKSYSRARISRLVLALLSPLPPCPSQVPYCRVLGFNEHGRTLIKAREGQTPLVVNTAKDARKLTQSAHQVLEGDIRRQNLADVLACQGQGRDYTHKPIIF